MQKYRLHLAVLVIMATLIAVMIVPHMGKDIPQGITKTISAIGAALVLVLTLSPGGSDDGQ